MSDSGGVVATEASGTVQSNPSTTEASPKVAGLVTVQSGDFNVTTNRAVSAEELSESLKSEEDKSASAAASKLGKRGAKARAEKASEEPKPIKPIPAREPSEPEDSGSEPAAAPPDDSEEKPEEKKPNPRHDPKARMLEATRKEAEAKRALAQEREARAALEQRLAALEQIAKRVQGEPEQPKAQYDGSHEPSPDEFDTYEQYLKAMFKWERTEWEKSLHQRITVSAADKALAETVYKFREAAGSDLTQYSDEVLSLRAEYQLAEGETPDGSNWIANELVFSPESAPALMLHFTAHPEDLQRIAALTTPRAVSREMAKIEARLEAATSGPSTKQEDAVSKAAPPVKPVTGKPYVSDGDSWRPGMSLDAYRKVWEKQIRRR